METRSRNGGGIDESRKPPPLRTIVGREARLNASLTQRAKSTVRVIRAHYRDDALLGPAGSNLIPSAVGASPDCLGCSQEVSTLSLTSPPLSPLSRENDSVDLKDCVDFLNLTAINVFKNIDRFHRMIKKLVC